MWEFLSFFFEIIEAIIDIFGMFVGLLLGSGMIGMVVIYFVIKYFVNKGEIHAEKNAQNQKAETTQASQNTSTSSARTVLIDKLDKIRQEAEKWVDEFDDEEASDQADVEIITPRQTKVEKSEVVTDSVEVSEPMPKKDPKIEDIPLNRRLRDYKLKKHEQQMNEIAENAVTDSPIEVEVASFDNHDHSMKDMLVRPRNLAEAFVLKELLDKPVSMRKNHLY